MKKKKIIVMLLTLFVCAATLTGYGTYNSEAAALSANTKARRTTYSTPETSETDSETIPMPVNDIEAAHTAAPADTPTPEIPDATAQPDISVQPPDKPVIDIKVTDTVSYSPQADCPNIPDTHIITYYNEVTKQEEQIEGILIDCVQSGEADWLGGYDIKGIFTATADGTTEWVLEGIGNISLSQNADSPSWDNYQSDILTYLGLEDTKYRITGACWDGDAYYDENGLLCRKAVYTGEALVTGYTAIYEGTGQAYAH